MAKQQRQKKARTAAKETSGPGRPAWSQPPPKSRKQVRRNQTTAAGATAHAAAPAVRREPAPRPRLGESLRAYPRPALILLVIAACGVGAVQLLRLPQLTVTATSIQIGGSHRISIDEIYRNSGLEGRSVLLVRSADVAARVAGIQGIAGADVHIRLPNQVLIDVREYAPLVAWQGITNTVWLSIDGAEVPQTGGLPPLRLSDQTGSSLEERRQTWRNLLPNLAALHEARPDVSELSYGKLEGLYFRSPAGWTVWLGDNGPMTAKLALLKAAEHEIAARGARASIIDVRSSDKQAFWW